MNPKKLFVNGLVGLLGSNKVSYQAPQAAPVQGPPAPPQPSAEYINRIREAIAHNETGIIKDNPYGFSQHSGQAAMGNALGRYQVVEDELKRYAPRYLGQPIDPKTFLASSTAQDNYITGKIKRFLGEGYTPQNVADIHRRGFTRSGNPGYTNYQDPDYVAKFNAQFEPQPVASAPKVVR